MPDMPRLNPDPAEGSRDTVDRELERQKAGKKQSKNEGETVDHLAGVKVSGQPQGGAADRKKE